MRIKLEIPFPKALLSSLDEAIDTTDLPDFFTAITTDSRLVEKGDIFIALRGKKQDGNTFLEKALERGASLLVGERRFPSAHTVTDSALFFARLASLHLSLNRPYVIAITGSVGKTTTKEYVARALSLRYNVHKTKENENNLLGLAKTLLSRPKECQVLIAELGSNHPGEIALLSSLLCPDTAILTAIGHAHLGMFGGEEEIFLEKTSILKNLSEGATAFLNGDDARLRSLSPTKDHRFFFVSQKGVGDLYAESIDFFHQTASFTLCNKTRALPVSLPLVSPVGLWALLFALSLAGHLGIGWEEALTAFGEPIAVKGRQQLLALNEYTIIDDTYNASPESMKAALSLLLKVGEKRRRIAVLGDMAELGDGSTAIHEEIGREAARAAHLLIAFGKMADAYKKGALSGGLPQKDIHTFQTAKACCLYISKNIFPHDVILIKASHVAGGDMIVKELIRDTHNASK